MKKVTERKLLGPSSKGMKSISGDESKCAVTVERLEALRDDLIAKAGQGEISADQAEAEAEAGGLPPLASEPHPSKYDPMAQARWSLLQAIAWIAWRDLDLVREQNSEFRCRCTHWVLQEWDQPIKGGTKFTRRKGWFLEPWRPSSALLLLFNDNSMRAAGKLPEGARLTPAEAERDLWLHLSEGRLTAEGFDRAGIPVEIPVREWEYVKRFEDRSGRQIFKYHALDNEAAFSEVRFKRDDMLAIWPCYKAVDLEALDLGTMLDLPLDRVLGAETYVPLSLAICWVASRSGVNPVSLRDEPSWRAAAQDVLSRISDGKIEIVGCDRSRVSNVLPRTIFALIEAPHPLLESLRQISGDETYLSSAFLTGQEEWLKSSNDRLFIAGDRTAAWTHLQVKRSHVAKLWPKPSAKAVASFDCQRWLSEEMKASPDVRPHPKDYYRQLARKKFKGLSDRQFLIVWDATISSNGANAWSKPGRPKGKSNRSAD